MRRIASLFLCVLALSASPTTAVGGRSKLWKCKHNQLKTPKLSYAVITPSANQSADGRRAARSATTYQPIRIHVEYDTALKYSQTAESRRIKTKIIPNIVNFFQRTLKVKRMTTNILLSRPCSDDDFIQLDPHPVCSYSCEYSVKCLETSVPWDHLAACKCRSDATYCYSSGIDGSGISNADFALYVSFTSSDTCDESTLAYASYCALEPSLDRPVAGGINFCPLALDTVEDDNEIIATAMHELTHTLTFSHLLMPFWRYSNGRPRTLRDPSTGLPPKDNDGLFLASSTTVKVQSKSWETYNGFRSRAAHTLVTEAVKREARSHYNCSIASGLELEYEGGGGSRFSHWEMRLVENEMMAPASSKDSVLSRLTLAAYEDSGWYQVDYSVAEMFRFGQDLGCGFLDQSCLTWLKDSSHHSKQPYCQVDVDRVNKSRDCTFDRQSVARCLIYRSLTAVDSLFQYFSDPKIQGLQFYSYCPVPNDLGTVDYVLNDINSTDGRCRLSKNQPNYRFNTLAEEYGSGCRCINHGTSQRWSVNGKTVSDTGGGCYKYFCTKSGLVVSVLGVNYTCPCEGAEIVFDINYSNINYHVMGSLICPSCKDICWDTSQKCPSEEPPQCYGKVQHTTAVTRTSCVGQPFCTYQPGPPCDNLCFNGGTCDTSGTCVCAAGFTGPSCNTAICTPTCRNGGTCKRNATTSTAECDCPVDTEGSYCQYKVTCYPSCQNGGICYSLYYSPQCYCAVEGTSGSYCQNKVTCTPACRNGGTCHVDSSSAHCDCPSGYTGSYCQYSACSPACQNGGTCQGSSSFSYCDCPSGYTGSYCQTRDCSPACQNGGICHRSSSFSYCDCPSGYTGDYCQNRDCSPACQNGGTCQGSSSFSYCDCPSGYTGSYCQTRDCSPACQNGGTCHRSSSNAYCDCPSGYTGDYCQNRDCSPACQNGGTCHRSSSNAYCDCPSGYTGSYCQNRVTCTTACQNGGTCHVNSSSVYCDCPSGYTGDYCQTRVICTPACRNGGTCHDNSFVIHCDCPSGFSGSYCQYQTCKPSCQNGGTCIAGSCVCPHEYNGSYCQHSSFNNSCSPSCDNGGTCGTNGVCYCPSGYGGSHCQVSSSSSSDVGSTITSSIYIAGIAAGVTLLFVGVFVGIFIAITIVLVIIRRKRRREQVLQNQLHNVTPHRGQPVGTTSGLQSTPRPLDPTPEEIPMISGEEEEAVEDSDVEGINLLEGETDDEQPLLPN